MNPTLYDILGVAPTASRDEIKAAWRDAADRFEPGSGGSSAQFRLFNEAAEVLLDPQRRQEYDAQLDVPTATSPPVEPVETSPTAETPPGGETAPVEPVETSPVAGTSPTAETPSVEPVETSERPRTRGPLLPRREKKPSKEKKSRTRTGSTTAGPPRRGVAMWVLFVLGLLAGSMLGLAIYFGVDYAKADAYQEALGEAPQAAERAAAAVLSYDYERLDADRDAAAKFLTPSYREQYVDTFNRLVTDSAEETKAKVNAEVLATSTRVDTREGRDPEHIRVLLFVDQTTISSTSSGEPRTALNRVQFDMVEQDGTWLVDDVTSY